MPSEKVDLLFEIGCEELPASFVEAALEALPGLVAKRLGELRLAFEKAVPYGTPRRLAVVVHGVDAAQVDLDEEVLGPPTRAAFKDGVPTRAAEAFADKLGVSVADLRKVETPKGEYLAGTRKEKGRPARELLPAALETLLREIPFRKSMRWADLDFAFGRPIQWLVALLGSEVIHLDVAAVKSSRMSRGHRFLFPHEVSIALPAAYVDALRAAHVLVDPKERLAALEKALREAAEKAGGVLIPDAFLMGENVTLVEEPHVIVGDFEKEFLDLPEHVILEVAKGHQRYFGLRAPLPGGGSGKLMPNYLAVVNTALDPATIRRGNNDVMRARLSDARFFFKTDLATPLVSRREKLAGVVFQKKLGSVLGKAERIERLAKEIGADLKLPEATVTTATRGAHLAKCDLVSLMVGEFPELQGEMGSAYARAQGEPAEVAEVISDHYRPKGASDATAKTDAGALVAIADRADTLVGCFSVGLMPTGAADPFALRRACLAILRTMIDRNFDLSIGALTRRAHAALGGVKLELSADEAAQKVQDFASERLRGLLEERLLGPEWNEDEHVAKRVVRACLGAGADRPLDVWARIAALNSLDDATLDKLGEVFKRATNIAKEAKPGDPEEAIFKRGEAFATEKALFDAFVLLRTQKAELGKTGDYGTFLRAVAGMAPVMEKYFVEVFVMCDDIPLRENRLRLMGRISELCASVARLELLGG